MKSLKGNTLLDQQAWYRNWESEVEGTPYISVIVTAYNRRQYLPDALRSLEAQTLSKDKFEVIVVKNFEDLPQTK